MKKKLVSVLLVAAMAASMLLGCGSKADSGSSSSGTSTSADASDGGTFVVPVNTNSIASLTPYNVYGSDDLLIASAPCFDPLYIITADGTRWYLADSMEPTSDDGMHYEMKLKDGLKWHDGEPITADDVVFTVDMFKDTSNTGATSESVTYNNKTLSAEKVDDLTVAITLQEPFSAFETEFGRIQIIPKHIFDGNTNVADNKKALKKCIGSGPFKLKEYKEGDSIVYERNDDYYRGKPSLAQVVIKMMPDESAQEAALQSGEISMMRVTNQTKLDKYKKDSDYKVYTLPEGRLNYLAFNYQSPIMQDIDARKAICLALNDDDIIKGAYGSEELALPAKNFCAPQNLYYNDEMTGYQQNIEEAKKLAEKSGLTKTTLHYMYFTARPNMKETAQIVQEQLKKIGVKMEIEGVDSGEFFQRLFAAWVTGKTVVDTSWDLASNGMDQLNADPATKMTSWTGDLLEKGFYVSPETKDLWIKASQSLTTEDREKYYKELQVQMNEDYSMYPMANTNYVIVARKEFKGLDEIKRVPIFEDYLKISMEK
ncbi:ABC transporter substrate-binding protein [Dorea longicatena]|uniref:ABC transporter substrate-binding protein n=1 Tax=Dorea longicatena TaxID=88431 RepID=UPI00189F8830|nr:ABC transporter substrate-binding protein [Dorea longicatena]